MNNKNIAIICLVLTFLLPFALYRYSVFRREKIRESGVYVLAYVQKIDSDLEGVNYRFFYNYSGKRYFSRVGSLDLSMQNSIITLQISKNDPEAWIIEERKLPECVLNKASLEKSWDCFPSCDL